MLRAVQVTNFRSLVSTGRLPLKPLTILVGANGAGKSSLLKLLLMIRQTVDSLDTERVIVTNGPYVELGAWNDLISFHEEARQLKFSVEWLPTVLAPRSRYKVGDIMTLEAELQHKNGVISVLGLDLSDEGGALFHIAREPYGVYWLTSDRLQMRPKVGRDFRPVKFYGLPYATMEMYQKSPYRYFGRYVRDFERKIQGISYLGPLRDYPKRFYVASGERPRDVGLRGESAGEVLGSAPSGSSSSSVRDQVGKWLQILGLAATVSVTKIRGSYYYLTVIDQTSQTPVNLADTGFGVSQVLPIIVECLYAGKNSTILIEQPEVHLHPRAQAYLADFFIDVSREKQLIVETHSENLLARLQRRIAEEAISPESVAIYSFGQTKRGTVITELELTQEGYLPQLPPGFWETDMDDRLQQMHAVSARAKKGGQTVDK